MSVSMCVCTTVSSRCLQETVARYALGDVYRWAYKPEVNFYFEVHSDTEGVDNPVFTVNTSEVRALCVPSTVAEHTLSRGRVCLCYRRSCSVMAGDTRARKE